MGKVKISIEIDKHPDGYVLANGRRLQVTGVVSLTLKKDVKANSLVIKLKGFAESHYEEQSGSGGSGDYYNTSQTVTQTDALVVVSQVLLDKEGPPNDLLSKGHYSFAFNLEANTVRKLPSSFEGGNGSIRYHLKVKLDRGSWFASNTKIVPLQVWNPAVLLPFRWCVGRVEIEEEHLETTFCVPAGSIIGHASMESAVVVCDGEKTFDIELCIDNLTNKLLIPTAYVSRCVTYMTYGHVHTSLKKWEKTKGEFIMPNTRRNKIFLQIGPVDCRKTGNINIFTNWCVSMDFKVKIKLKGSGFKMSHPVQISEKSTVQETGDDSQAECSTPMQTPSSYKLRCLNTLSYPVQISEKATAQETSADSQAACKGSTDIEIPSSYKRQGLNTMV